MKWWESMVKKKLLKKLMVKEGAKVKLADFETGWA